MVRHLYQTVSHYVLKSKFVTYKHKQGLTYTINEGKALLFLKCLLYAYITCDKVILESKVNKCISIIITHILVLCRLFDRCRWPERIPRRWGANFGKTRQLFYQRWHSHGRRYSRPHCRSVEQRPRAVWRGAGVGSGVGWRLGL